ncbi:flagellar motor protein MotB [Breoghania sp.]|uniref:flagellar motor protein MotB n=1 Tax=Breoghania sp. TaxID=2065378 RepID=UPI002AAB2AA1|nr:flagellar motor protein MotB [Breoghania sp.]
MIPDRAQEIVIVRRRNPLFAEPPKGGVWKIAYADFMTAMMAFFLVMWLINVTDDATKKGVAQYFNPVNLAATSPNRKGLNDPDQTGVTNEDGRNQPQGEAGTGREKHGANVARPIKEKTPAPNPGKGATIDNNLQGPAAGRGADAARGGEFAATYSEEALFSDPYAVLDKLASTVPGPVTEEEGSGNAGFGDKEGKGARGGDAYRDPFDPLYWQFTPKSVVEGGPRKALRPAVVAAVVKSDVKEGAEAGKPLPKAKPGEVVEKIASSRDVRVSERTVQGKGATDGVYVENKATTVEVAKVAAATETGTGPAAHAGSATGPGTGLGSGTGPGAGIQPVKVEGPALKNSVHTAQRLRERLAAIAKGPLRNVAAQVEIVTSNEGVLISLTDANNFGMFAIGSAEPRPQLVHLMEEIGKTLSDTKGDVIIRGHTDARPFTSGSYDNWRLSTARAHIAYYMLMRGGLDGKRVERVEGYADRVLKVPADPYAASNRRIEILLKEVRS